MNLESFNGADRSRDLRKPEQSRDENFWHVAMPPHDGIYVQCFYFAEL